MDDWVGRTEERKSNSNSDGNSSSSKEAAKQQSETHVAMGLEFVGGGCLDAE